MKITPEKLSSMYLYLPSENPEPSLSGNALEGVEITKQPKEKNSMVWSRPQESNFPVAAQGTLTDNAEGEDLIRPAWRHADPSRNVLGVQI